MVGDRINWRSRSRYVRTAGPLPPRAQDQSSLIDPGSMRLSLAPARKLVLCKSWCCVDDRASFGASIRRPMVLL
jgi:hypothetical protein